MNATTQTSYDPSNFSVLAPVMEKAKELLAKSPKLQAKVIKAVRSSNASLTEGFQITKPEGGSALRPFTFGELADSAINENNAQSVDPSAVSDVLFGRYGLIQKAGGGRTEFLMEDIEVAFIKDLVSGDVQGPIITSGRHRTLALQVMLIAAGIRGYRDVYVRCSVIVCNNAQEIQARIISANTGSRDFSRAEIRERNGSTSGLVLFSCESIDATIVSADNLKEFKAAFSSYIKLAAAELGLNHFTPAQYSDAGNSLWNTLDSARPEGGTMAKWIKADKQGRFAQVMDSVKATLPTAVIAAQHSEAKGPKATRLAKALAPNVIAQCF